MNIEAVVGAIFQPTKLEFQPPLLEREVREEETKRIVGQAGSKAPGLYKDKSFPWNKKKGGDAWKSVECC